MSEYEHGSMEIETQQKTFDGFIRLVTNVVIGIAVFLIFLALVNG